MCEWCTFLRGVDIVAVGVIRPDRGSYWESFIVDSRFVPSRPCESCSTVARLIRLDSVSFADMLNHPALRQMSDSVKRVWKRFES
jgi:hypothetical protein